MWILTEIAKPKAGSQRYKKTIVVDCDHCRSVVRRPFCVRKGVTHSYCSSSCTMTVVRNRAKPKSADNIAGIKRRAPSMGAASWTPERREAHRAALKAAWDNNPARKAAFSVAMKERARRHWDDPEWAARTRAKASSPETLQRRSASGKIGCISAMEKKRDTRRMAESAGERELAALIESICGAGSVDRHVTKHGYNVDVYVTTHDVWVSFDGVYYHGLDRPYESLSNQIRRKFDRDRAADAVFAEHGDRLVRITCREWRDMGDETARRDWIRRAVLCM